MTDRPSDPLRNLRALRHKVDHHAAQVMAAHPQRFACRAGCAGCCHSERRVFDVELAALRGAVDALAPEVRAQLRAGDEGRCSLLLPEGRCAVYTERPILCRSHGLPLRIEQQLDVCPLNFVGEDLSALPPEQLLSVDAVTTVLVVVNQLYCQETGGEAGRRTAVGVLVGEVADREEGAC